MSLLTAENYRTGFLVDEELMGGVTESPDAPGRYLAFVLRHTTGEYLGYRSFAVLEEALEAINRVQRSWAFEKASGCGSGNCGGGSCGKGQCGLRKNAAVGSAERDSGASGSCPDGRC